MIDATDEARSHVMGSDAITVTHARTTGGEKDCDRNRHA